MTTQNKSGTEDKVRVEGDLNELKPGEGFKVDEKTTYEYGSDLSTDGTPLIDPATGKTVSIRTFEFLMNPEAIKDFPEDRQLIFNNHAKQISTILWGDGLIPLEEVAPRVIINKREGKYQIFVPCEARLSTTFVDKPKSLSEQLINKNETTGH